jgi:hypothetical protein
MWVSVRAHHIRTHTWYVLKHPHILYLCSSLLCPWLPSRDSRDHGPRDTDTDPHDFAKVAGVSAGGGQVVCVGGAAWRAYARAVLHGAHMHARCCMARRQARVRTRWASPVPTLRASKRWALEARPTRTGVIGAIVGRDRRARSSGANAAARVCMSAGAHDILTEPCCCRGGAAA